MLRLTANDGELSTADDVTITVEQSAPVNQAPQVDAGLAQTVAFGAAASLNGTVTDDGPAGNVTTSWTKVSGPGTVTFNNSAAVDTSATFSAAGQYVLRLTANDGQFAAQDEVTITVDEPVTQPGGLVGRWTFNNAGPAWGRRFGAGQPWHGGRQSAAGRRGLRRGHRHGRQRSHSDQRRAVGGAGGADHRSRCGHGRRPGRIRPS